MKGEEQNIRGVVQGFQRRVLMLCYHYTPAINGGVERSVRFARYLPEFGWTPVVMTTDRFGVGGGAVAEELIRVGELRISRLRASRGRFPRRGNVSSPPPGFESTSSSTVGAVREWVDRWFMVPDDKIRWGARAFLPAWRMLRRGEADVIYTTSPPASSHLIGMKLKKLTGKPWIMDLRDPWTIEPLHLYLRKGGVRLKVEKSLERLSFKCSDTVVINTAEAAERYRELFPKQAGKIVVIPNGFDAEEMMSSGTEERALREIDDGVFVMSHVGSFFRYTDMASYPAALFRALRTLVDDEIINTESCRVLFVGNIHADARRRMEEFGLHDLIELTGAVPHAAAVGIMQRSDLLILFDPAPKAEYYIHGKLYEYLSAGGWILAMVPPGASRNLLECSGHGLIVSPDDTEGIRRAIVTVLERRNRPSTSPDFDLSRYERKRLTSKLAECLDELCPKRDRNDHLEE